jgi:hypothetical protein
MGPKTYRALEIAMWIGASIAMLLAVYGYLKR